MPRAGFSVLRVGLAGHSAVQWSVAPVFSVGAASTLTPPWGLGLGLAAGAWRWDDGRSPLRGTLRLLWRPPTPAAARLGRAGSWGKRPASRTAWWSVEEKRWGRGFAGPRDVQVQAGDHLLGGLTLLQPLWCVDGASTAVSLR